MTLRPLQEEEFGEVAPFVKPLWQETYGDLLPQRQVDYLFDYYFSPERIAAFRAQGYEYFFLTDGEERLGLVVLVERPDEVYLDKLYLTPAARGKGYPAFVFSELKRRGKDITLNVNRANVRACKAYRKNGFVVLEEQKIPLPDGMVNYDYKMCLPVGRKG